MEAASDGWVYGGDMVDGPQQSIGYQDTIKLSGMDLDDDFVDEDDLLSSYNILMTGLSTATPDVPDEKDCSTSRTACKNCSCGRADGSLDESKPSACGSCYLGDAFRCATCPSKGQPAFSPGEKVMITI